MKPYKRMKKIVCSLLLLMVLAFAGRPSLVAQELQKNILGIDVGVNLSSASISGTFLNIAPSNKIGFRAGVSYQRLLLASTPFYLETGLYFLQKGMIQKDKEMELTLSLSHIQVPILVNYRIDLGSNFTVIPAAGLYYSYGINGNYTFSGTSGDPEYDEDLQVLNDYVVYGEKGELKRSNLGLRLAVGLDLKAFNLTFAYERDVLNTSKIEKRANDHAKTKNKILALSVGYRF